MMDRAYEGGETRALAVELGFVPVVPPKSNRKDPWNYDKDLYKQRNQAVSELDIVMDKNPNHPGAEKKPS